MTKRFENLQVGALPDQGRFRAALFTPEHETVWQSAELYTDITAAYVRSGNENKNRDAFRSFMAEVWAR